MNRQLRGHQDFAIRFLGGEFATHMTCQDADCEKYANGWTVILDGASAKGAEAANWIKNGSGRRFIEVRSEGALEYLTANAENLGITVSPSLRELLGRTPAGFVIFLFPPRQQCFALHEDREVVFSHHRAGQSRIHTRPLDFNEQFNIEGDKVNRARQRG